MAQAQLFVNNAAGQLSAGIDNSVTTIVLTSGAGALFPSPGGSQFFMATLRNVVTDELEIVRVTSRTADTMTVVRGQEGTAPLAFNAGDVFGLRPTALAYNTIYSYIDAAVAALTATLFGIGQLWAVFTGTRALNTLYTNNTGKAICVFVSGAPGIVGLNFSAEINGVIGVIGLPNADGVSVSNIFFIVPAGATYRVFGSGITMNYWSEMR